MTVHKYIFRTRFSSYRISILSSQPEIEKLTVRAGYREARAIHFKPSACFTIPGHFPPPQVIDPYGLFLQCW